MAAWAREAVATAATAPPETAVVATVSGVERWAATMTFRGRSAVTTWSLATRVKTSAAERPGSLQSRHERAVQPCRQRKRPPSVGILHTFL